MQHARRHAGDEHRLGALALPRGQALEERVPVLGPDQEARLPAEVLVNLPDIPLEAVAICADLDHNVFNPSHTDAKVAAALQDTYWYDLGEWARRGPRA